MDECTEVRSLFINGGTRDKRFMIPESLHFFMKDERLLESQHKWILNEETEDKILPTDSSLLLGEFQKSWVHFLDK
jgi:hypothetical protein